MRKNKMIGCCFALLGLLVTIYAATISTRVALNEPGPKVFPLISGIGIFVCGIGIFVTEYRNSAEDEKPFLDLKGWKRYGIAMLVLAAYYLGLEVLGFLISSPFIILALSRLFSQKKYNWPVGIIVSVVSTALIYFIFNGAFHLPLPDGILF